MVNKLWCQEVARNLFQKKEAPPHARVFSEPKWEAYVSTWYLVYRSLIFLAWAAIIVCSIFEFGSFKPLVMYDKWPIYLTNWDLVLGLSQAAFGILLVVKRWRLQKIPGFDPSTLKLGSLERVYWFLNVVTTNIALGVTISYWCSVYNPKIHNLDPLNIMLHVCNSILMIIDLCITNIPFRLRCFWWCLTIVFFYIIFSVIYYGAGGLDKYGYHYIYKILDWKKPLPTLLVCMGEVMFITVLHLIICFLSKMKDRVYNKISIKLGRPLPEMESNNKSTMEKTADIV